MNFSMYAKFSNILLENGIEKAADYTKSLGFSSVEFFEFIGREWQERVPDTEEAKRMRKVLESRGLTVACYSIAVGLYEEGMTPDTVTAAEKKLLQYAERAAALQSPFLHHTLTLGVPVEQLTIEKAKKYIVPAAIRIAKYAHSLGVTCIYEDQGMFFNGVEGFGEFFRAVKAECPYVGVCGDVGNTLFVDERPEEFFRAYAHEIKHVHIKDYVMQDVQGEGAGWSVTRGGKWLKETIIGEGCINQAACLAELRRVGYSGAFAMENNHEQDFVLGTRCGMDLVEKEFSTQGGSAS